MYILYNVFDTVIILLFLEVLSLPKTYGVE